MEKMYHYSSLLHSKDFDLVLKSYSRTTVLIFTCQHSSFSVWPLVAFPLLHHSTAQTNTHSTHTYTVTIITFIMKESCN